MRVGQLVSIAKEMSRNGHDTEYGCTSDIKQGFFRYRVDVGDCLINAYYVLREPMLADLAETANSEMQEVAEAGRSVQALEATLFCISSIHEAVPLDEETVATQLFTGSLVKTVTKLTGIRYHRLQRTTLRMIGTHIFLCPCGMEEHFFTRYRFVQRRMLHGSATTAKLCCLCFSAQLNSSARSTRPEQLRWLLLRYVTLAEKISLTM